MKKIIVLALTVFTFLSCGEELEFNTPSFQAKKDGNLWEAVTYSATIDDSGSLTITGSDNFEIVTLVVNSTALGMHDVVTTSSYATVLDVNEVLWSTNNTPVNPTNPDLPSYPADGVITIKEFILDKGIVSGSFHFNAFNSSGLSSVNFNEGFFHNVPILGLEVEVVTGGNLSCPDALIAVVNAATDYSVADPSDTNYPEICQTYKTALLNQINACGDTGGIIQMTIDSLGTCN